MSGRPRTVRHALQRRHPAQAHIDRGYEAVEADHWAAAAREWLAAWELLRRDPKFEEVVRWEPADPVEPGPEGGPAAEDEDAGELSYPKLPGSEVDPFFLVVWFEEVIRV